MNEIRKNRNIKIINDDIEDLRWVLRVHLERIEEMKERLEELLKNKKELENEKNNNRG